jgi:hypothetical protein
MMFNKYRNLSLSFGPKGLIPPYEAEFWLLTPGGNSTKTENIIKGMKKIKDIGGVYVYDTKKQG